MKLNTFKLTSKDQISDDTMYDDALAKASAEYYERRAIYRINFRAQEMWIAVALYLILSSVAFVVLN
jgi:hypothetical protein